MRREYINYDVGVPVEVSFVSIEDYPIHWHNCIEIIYVLEGKLEVYINSIKYEIRAGELEIINMDEVHHLKGQGGENKVLIFYIDPYFFERYYSDIENMYFYTDSSTENAQAGEEYEELRALLAAILCEKVQKQEDYDENIKEILVELLYHLINNFNYLVYEKEELKEDINLFRRYHSISKYIANNYNQNITLQDIAEKEFLSPRYLSHEIKYATGYSFTELLNLTRVEESIKLLLDSDKTLSEISEEVGFSHLRYYNKNFKRFYMCTPLQFRKRYKVNEENLEKLKKVEKLQLKDSINYLLSYLQSYDRFNYEDRLIKIDIDVDNDLGCFNKDFKNVITIGDAFDLLIEDNKDTLEELQGEIGFQYGRILNVFSTDMAIFPESSFFNWNRNKEVLEFLYDIDIKPLIVIDSTGFSEDNFIEAFQSFLSYFSALESVDFSEIRFEYSNSVSDSLKERINELIKGYYDIDTSNIESYNDMAETNPIYDTAYMIPYIIHNIIFNNNSLQFLRAFDVLDKQVNITNEVFFGYPGLVNDMGIKKPSYYAYYLLNKLGDRLVAQDNGYIVTKSADGFQILLYNFYDNLDSLIPLKEHSNLKALKSVASKKLSLNITNIQSNIKVTSYEINENEGSSFNYWLQMGKPNRLSKEEKEILHKASFPEIEFKYFKKSAVVNIQAEIEGYGAMLILIEKVQKHQ
ncbi:MAG: helix-turn-helix domain-containing protein [Clostridiales bacterium]|nr:helix-turn-helix domain-containing protein [Clostridiales bacterium]